MKQIEFSTEPKNPLHHAVPNEDNFLLGHRIQQLCSLCEYFLFTLLITEVICQVVELISNMIMAIMTYNRTLTNQILSLDGTANHLPCLWICNGTNLKLIILL